MKNDYAGIIINNSDITKLASRKLEALSEIRDSSTGGVIQEYLTIEAAVLSAVWNNEYPEEQFLSLEKTPF